MDSSYDVMAQDLSPDDQSRERLIAHGPGSLTTVLLLVMVLQRGGLTLTQDGRAGSE